MRRAILIGALLLAAAAPLPRPDPARPAATPPAALASCPATAAAAPLDKKDVDAWLDGYLPYALARGDAAGAVVVVVKDGAILTQRGFGFADMATRRPIDPETTLFRQASISKTFTWTAVMQLVEAGKIDLDRDINAYLDFRIDGRGGRPITMRHLMTHRAGFEELQRGLDTYDPHKIVPLGTMVKRWVPRRIFAPGTTSAYSNYGTGLAGYIVERVSGQPFADYVERHIFAPAGMSRASFRQPLPPALRGSMASGYLRGSGRTVPFEIANLPPAGGLTASGADMARFLIAHLDQGGRLLRPATKAMMQNSVVHSMPPLNGMALGFYEQTTNGRRILSHAGDTAAFHSQLWMFPKERIGLYVSINAAGTDNVSGPIRSQLLQGFTDRYFPAAPCDGRVDAETARAHARMMVGTWNKTRRSETSFLKLLELGGQMHIRLDNDGGLQLGAAPAIGGAPRHWTEIAPFVWRDRTSKLRLAAQVENGRAVRFGLDSSAPFMLFERVPWQSSTAWAWPALLVALGAALLTALSWPAAALIRRHHGIRPTWTRAERIAYRGLRAAAVATLLVAAGWLTFLTTLLKDFGSLGGELDWALIALQIATPLALLGLLATALCDTWLARRRGASLAAIAGRAMLVACSMLLLWVALVFHLIGFGTNF